jgi:hypothetical protein
MSSGRPVVLIALVALAAFAAWRLLAPSPEPTEPPEEPPAAAGPRVPSAPPPLATGPHEPAESKPTPTPTPAPAATPAARGDPKKVRLSVRAPDGGSLAGAVVHVWRRSGLGSTDGRAVVGPDGSVEVDLADDLAAGAAMGSLVVEAPGRPPVQVTIDPALREKGSADVVLGKTVEITGRAFGPDGRPVARLPIVATTAEPLGLAVFAEHVDLAEALKRNRWVEIVHATADDQGQFTLKVSPDVPYWILTDADGWLVRPPPRVQAAASGALSVEVNAVPAVTLRSRVTDASGGAGIPYPFVRVTPRFPAEGQAISWGASSSDFRGTWARGAEFTVEAAFDGSVSAEGNLLGDAAGPKEGYVPQALDLRFPPGETSIRRDVALARASPVGAATLTYEFTDADGMPADPPLPYLEARPDGDLTFSFPALKRIETGRHRATVAPGAWMLVVRLRQPLRDLVRFEDRVTLAADETRTLSHRLPRTGRLHLDWPYTAQPAGWSVSLAAIDGSVTHDAGTPERGSLDFVAVPVGRWRVSVYPAGEAEHALSREIEITAGSTTSVDLGKPEPGR